MTPEISFDAHLVKLNEDYTGVTLPATLEIPSSSGSGTYRVTVFPDSFATCTCTGFKYRTLCKHLDIARDALGVLSVKSTNDDD